MVWDPVARACSSTVVAQASQHCPRELARRVVLLVPLYFSCAFSTIRTSAVRIGHPMSPVTNLGQPSYFYQVKTFG